MGGIYHYIREVGIIGKTFPNAGKVSPSAPAAPGTRTSGGDITFRPETSSDEFHPQRSGVVFEIYGVGEVEACALQVVRRLD